MPSLFLFLCISGKMAAWNHHVLQKEGETWDLYTSIYKNSRTCVIFRCKKRQCFPLLDQENMVFILRQIPPICLMLYGCRVCVYVCICVCVCAKVGAIQETLRSVCIFSQSDWSKTQPLMCHFKWTPGPNENTHTYKPHLIEGYRFSHSRQFLLLLLLLLFLPRGEGSTFWKSIFLTCFPTN